MAPPDDDLDDELDDDLDDDDLAPAAAPAVTPMQTLAADLLKRLQAAGGIEVSSKRAKSLLDGLADQLGSLGPTKPAGPTLGAWLADHDAVEELYASDAELEAALKESVAAVGGR